MTWSKRIGFFALDVLKVYGLYCAIVLLGTSLLMFLAQSIGYSTYSDRPGTGWFGFHPNFSLDQADFLLSFVAFTAEATLLSLIGPAVMLATVAIARTRIPTWLMIVLITAVYGWMSFELVLEMGWYIAIDASFAVAAAVLCVPFSLIVMRVLRGGAPRRTSG